MNFTKGFFDFIKTSTDAYNAVNTVRERLISEGFTELFEDAPYHLSDGGKYFVTRADSSLIAFVYKSGASAFVVSAAHSDFPSFKLKPSASANGVFKTLATEKYGGAINYSWFDRPLSVSGRVITECDGKLKSNIVRLECDLAVIPSVAIHLSRDVNNGFSPNANVDMKPLVADVSANTDILSLIADKCGTAKENIIAHDLYLYNRQEPVTYGLNGEFILCARFDDLSHVYTSLEGFLLAKDNTDTTVLAIFDNEECGSESRQGAASTFLYDTLCALAPTEEKYRQMIARSFMVSADVAHSVHPAHPELSDKDECPRLNGGIVIKYNANQRYATDAESAAMFKLVCKRAGVPTQNFVMRPDMPCGSTLGHISVNNLPIRTVDVGLPILSMHSAAETAGTLDLTYMINAMIGVYSTPTSELLVK